MAQRRIDLNPSGPFPPPQNIEAEMSALGAMLLSEKAVDLLIESLAKEDFYVPAHAEIFLALKSLYAQHRPVDMVTLKDELKRRDKLQEIGGEDYIVQLGERVPTSLNAEYYADIVRDKAMLRGLERAGREIVGMVHDPEGTAMDKIDDAEARVFAIGQRRLGETFRPVVDIAKDFFKDIDKLYEGNSPVLGLQTHFTDLDRITTGFYPGDLVIVAARPAMGKTSLVLNFALEVAKQQVGNVAIFSLEMTGEQLVRRLVSMISKVPMQVMRRPNMSEPDYERLTDASEELYDLPLYIDDNSDISPGQMRAKCRRLKADGGLALVVVDYLQLMRGDRRTDNRTQEIAEIARGLKSMSKELKCPVIALSQLNRAVEGRPNKRPMLSDLRESGSIEAEADIVMMIYRHDYYKAKDGSEQERDSIDKVEVAELIIQKHRSGDTGTVLLGFQKSFTLFSLLDDQSKDEYRSKVKNDAKDEE